MKSLTKDYLQNYQALCELIKSQDLRSVDYPDLTLTLFLLIEEILSLEEVTYCEATFNVGQR